MIGQLIDVLIEDGCIMLAKIVDRVSDHEIVVKFMNPVKRRYNDLRVYNFSESGEIIPVESISGYYDTDDTSMAGYLSIGDGFIKTCEDEAYVPDEDEDSESGSDSESYGNSDSDEEAVQDITCAIGDIDMGE